jgi:hypothetical protein
MGEHVTGGPIEQKAVAAPSATLAFGYLSALLIEVIPWLKDNLTADQQQNLPVVIAFIASLIAAYLAPHTHRPDLPPVTPPQAAPPPPAP